MARGITNSRGHFKVRFGKIYIPHLDYEVLVKPISGAKDLPDGSCAFARNVSCGVVELYFAKMASPPTVTHECVHAVQMICNSKMIDMVSEMEHVAYMVDYLVAKVLGYSN